MLKEHNKESTPYIVIADQLAFCSNECIEAYQSHLDFDVENEDVELVDAVKTAYMATTDPNKIFQPLPSTDYNGIEFGGFGGLDAVKVASMVDKKHPGWKRWHFSVSSAEKFKYEVQLS